MRPDIDDKCAHDWLLRSAHMSSHVQHTEAEEGHTAQSVTEHTHTHKVTELLVGDFQLYGSPGGALYVGMREELSSSIA